MVIVSAWVGIVVLKTTHSLPNTVMKTIQIPFVGLEFFLYTVTTVQLMNDLNQCCVSVKLCRASFCNVWNCGVVWLCHCGSIGYLLSDQVYLTRLFINYKLSFVWLSMPLGMYLSSLLQLFLLSATLFSYSPIVLSMYFYVSQPLRFFTFLYPSLSIYSLFCLSSPLWLIFQFLTVGAIWAHFQ